MNVRRRTLLFWTVSVVCLDGLACFRSFDPSKVECVGDTTCPSGYTCSRTAGQDHGTCVSGGPRRDGSTGDLPLSSAGDGSSTADRSASGGGGGNAGSFGGTSGGGGTTVADGPSADTADVPNTASPETGTTTDTKNAPDVISGSDVPTGGTSGADGSTGPGGTRGTGGVGTGGSTGPGGAPGTGGIGAGGVAGTTGGTGGTHTGGTSATGGAATGGTSATGGAATGGTSATGGAATGGAPGTGGTTLGGLGHACTSHLQCAQDNCIDGVCCDSPCNGTCQACGSSGHCNVTPATDANCPTVTCPANSTCGSYTAPSAGACKSFGACKTSTDCALSPVAARTSCATGSLCDGQGNCKAQHMKCGSSLTCDLSIQECCLDVGLGTYACTELGNEAICAKMAVGGTGTSYTAPATCDKDTDCPSGQVCCLNSVDGNNGVECIAAADCKSQTFYERHLVCASPETSTSCPSGQSCAALYSGGINPYLPGGWMVCQ
jgi:hypothetical protein